MSYILHLLVLVLIYVILAYAADLLAGHTGLLSIAHAAFFGLGAYSSAIVTSRYGVGFLSGAIVGIGVAIALSLCLSLSSMRLRGDYFAIASFAFQMIIFNILNNWMEVTRGPLGIPGIPPPIILGWRVDTAIEFVLLSGALVIVCIAFVWRLTSRAYGRVLHMIREDEVLATALGKNPARFKIQVFAASAALCAVAGSVYAHYVTYVSPVSFTVMESILILSMVIIGGAGSSWGPLIGATILVTLPELLRFIGLPMVLAANLRQMIYGASLVIMMVSRPQGIVGQYQFDR